MSEKITNFKDVSEQIKEEGKEKFELLFKELNDKEIKENDLIKVRLSSRLYKAGPDGLYGTDTKGYFVNLTDEHLTIKGYTFENKEVIEKISIGDVEEVTKEQK